MLQSILQINSVHSTKLSWWLWLDVNRPFIHHTINSNLCYFPLALNWVLHPLCIYRFSQYQTFLFSMVWIPILFLCADLHNQYYLVQWSGTCNGKIGLAVFCDFQWRVQYKLAESSWWFPDKLQKAMDRTAQLLNFDQSRNLGCFWLHARLCLFTVVVYLRGFACSASPSISL